MQQQIDVERSVHPTEITAVGFSMHARGRGAAEARDADPQGLSTGGCAITPSAKCRSRIVLYSASEESSQTQVPAGSSEALSWSISDFFAEIIRLE